MKKNYLLILFIVLCSNAFSQGIESTKAFVVGSYSFFVKTDTTDFSCIVRVKKDGKEIATTRFIEETFIEAELLEENNGKPIFLMSAYTGGAHCCVTLYSVYVANSKVNKIDSLFLGNSGYGFSDINNDGQKELVTGNDMFAYAFTNYAETRFPAEIFNFNNGHFSNTTSQYRDLLLKEIDDLTAEMNDFLKEQEFKCEEDGADTFNSPAGSLKTILAAIAADYQSLGETQKGYDLIDKLYTCPDKEAYIAILKNDFKIK
ncbi:hypothetical protein BH10BAC5_BH10BAC5_15040 [soil metagenome]